MINNNIDLISHLPCRWLFLFPFAKRDWQLVNPPDGGDCVILQDERGFYWNLDPRLTRANPLSLTEEQAAAFVKRITCATLLISANEYWREKRDWTWEGEHPI